MLRNFTCIFDELHVCSWPFMRVSFPIPLRRYALFRTKLVVEFVEIWKMFRNFILSLSIKEKLCVSLCFVLTYL